MTRGHIVEELRRLGLGEGDVIQVHSSLSSFGYVEGGADAVVDALLELVGPEGTVMVPTFNHHRARVFDIRETPSVNGAVTEALRRRPEAKRSLHPTHPYAAIGKDAEELTSEHLELRTFDIRSPLGKLARRGGYVVLLGVGMNVNTAAHVGETMAEVPCLGFRKLPCWVRLPDTGRIVRAWSVLWRGGPCRIEWEPLEERMRNRGLIRDGRIGGAEVHVMRAMDVVRTAYEMAREPEFCPTCPARPVQRWEDLWPGKS
mgnify:CR=1 FL=1